MNDFLEVAVSSVIVACWLSSALFVFVYGIGAPWYRHEAGRQIFFSGLMFLEVCSLGMMSVFFGPEWLGRPYVRLAVWSQVLVFLLWRNRLLIEAQLRKEHAHDSDQRDRTEPEHKR